MSRVSVRFGLAASDPFQRIARVAVSKLGLREDGTIRRSVACSIELLSDDLDVVNPLEHYRLPNFRWARSVAPDHGGTADRARGRLISPASIGVPSPAPLSSPKKMFATFARSLARALNHAG